MNHSKRFFDFTVKDLTVNTRFGPVLFDGKDCSGDCYQFKHPTFRYIIKYYQLTKDPSIHRFLQMNIQAIWNLSSKKIGNNYVFAVNWAGPPPTGQIVQSQHNSAVSSILLFNELK